MIAAPFPWASFLLFTLANCATPGPNIIMLAGSGGRFGVRRTVPHLLGITFGFPVMLLLVWSGAGSVFRAAPWLLPALTVSCLVYVTWLAFRVAAMGWGAELKLKAADRPMTFLEAVAFQWVNGKAWQIALATATLYATDSAAARVAGSALFWAMILWTHLLWVELGKRIAGLLERPLARKLYYGTLAALLLLSVWPRSLETLLH